eukprot:PhM_4_TR13655/c1_g1_i1/m.15913
MGSVCSNSDTTTAQHGPYANESGAKINKRANNNKKGNNNNSKNTNNNNNNNNSSSVSKRKNKKGKVLFDDVSETYDGIGSVQQSTSSMAGGGVGGGADSERVSLAASTSLFSATSSTNSKKQRRLGKRTKNDNNKQQHGTAEIDSKDIDAVLSRRLGNAKKPNPKKKTSFTRSPLLPPPPAPINLPPTSPVLTPSAAPEAAELSNENITLTEEMGTSRQRSSLTLSSSGGGINGNASSENIKLSALHGIKVLPLTAGRLVEHEKAMRATLAAERRQLIAQSAATAAEAIAMFRANTLSTAAASPPHPHQEERRQSVAAIEREEKKREQRWRIQRWMADVQSLKRGGNNSGGRSGRGGNTIVSAGAAAAAASASATVTVQFVSPVVQNGEDQGEDGDDDDDVSDNVVNVSSNDIEA